VIPVDAPLPRRLVDTQFPQWADLPLNRLDPAGSDHVLYRLGPSLSVRLPRHPGAIGQAAKEARWLPRLARPLSDRDEVRRRRAPRRRADHPPDHGRRGRRR
jgi:aminoglycoside phosphotransferase (APT) family kinase protein